MLNLTDFGFVKNTFVLSWTLTVLSWGAKEYKRGYKQAKRLDEVYSVVRWGLDYLMKCHYRRSKLVAQVEINQINMLSNL